MVKETGRSTSPYAPGFSLARLWPARLRGDAIAAALLLMLVLVPLLGGSDLMNSRGKQAAFDVLGTLLLALTLGRATLRGGWADARAALLAGPNLPLAAFGAWCLASGLLAPFPAFAHMEMMRVGFGLLLYAVLVGYMKSREQMQVVADGLLLVTAAVSLLGLGEMAQGGGMVLGTFGNHELLGSFLMLMLPFALALGLSERGDPKRQVAAQSVALLAAACLLMAQTRSAWLGGAVSLLVLSLLAWRGQAQVKKAQAGTSEAVRHLRQHKHLVVGPLLLLAGSLALLVLLSGTSTDLQSRAHTLSSGEGNGWLARAPMWLGAWHAALARPLFGWGLGTYPVQAAHWTGFGDSAAQVLAHGTSHSNLAHNLYLQTAAEAGFVGLGLYLAALVLFFRTGLRALPGLDNGLRRAVLLGSLAAVAGQAVDALGSPAYNFASVSLFQWTMLGLGMCAAGVGARGRVFAETSVRSHVPSPLMRRAQWAFSGLAALGLMTQIVPTMNAAFAQTCTVPTVGTFRTETSGLNILRPGQSTAVISTFNGRPAHGVRYTLTYSPSPGVVAGLVTITPDTDYSLLIRRTGTAAPANGARITVRALYFDSNNQPYQNLSVTITLN